MGKRKIIIGVAGSSGSVYAQTIFRKLMLLSSDDLTVGVVMSDNAILNWEIEIGTFDPSSFPFTFYKKNDFMAPFASGSARYDSMIIIPSSMGLIGRIAAGISNDLMTRAADVIMKERRKLIIVPRETPYSLIHLRNLTTITEAGGIVCPACPSFYSKPSSIEEVVDTVVDRVLDLAGFDMDSFRWGE